MKHLQPELEAILNPRRAAHRKELIARRFNQLQRSPGLTPSKSLGRVRKQKPTLTTTSLSRGRSPKRWAKLLLRGAAQ